MTVTENISPPPQSPPATWGLLAEYADPAALVAAAERVRDAGYTRWDCCTPFPVHGLDRAMGIKRTILPWLVLGGGLAGLLGGIGLQWYVNSPQTVSQGMVGGYPLVFSGKPYWSLPANIPVAFEVTVLLSSLTAFFGLWALCRLPRLHHPAFGSPRFRRATDDRFFILIEAADPRFDPTQTAALLAETNPAAVEELQE